MSSAPCIYDSWSKQVGPFERQGETEIEVLSL